MSRRSLYATLVIVVAAAFARSLWALPIWDDEFLTTRNPHLATWSGVRVLVSTDIWSSSALEQKSGYYRPVASLSYALNRLVAGNSAAAYHAGNVVLHVLVAALLFRAITRRKIAPLGYAFAAVALFATMPLVAEPVSWLAGRYDLLGSVFALVALEANLHRRRAWTTALVYALALLSKESFIFVFAFVVLDDLFVLRRNMLAEGLKYASLVGAAAVCFLLRRFVGVPPPTRLLEQGGVMELVRAYVFSWQTTGALAVRPVNLCFFHTYVPATNAAVAVVLGILAVALVAALLAYRRAPSSKSRGGIVLGFVWCVLAMIPGALTAPTLRITGDRYAYLPLIGASIALAGLLAELARRHPALRFGPVVAVALAVVQLPRLESRLGELQSEDSMLQATLARDPDNFTTLTQWGQVLAKRGSYASAEEALEHARRVAPFTGDIDTALSYVHLHQRRFAEAERDARRAILSKPQNARAWLNLASALVDQHRPAEAVDDASEAIRLRPNFAEAFFVRGLAQAKLGHFDAARADASAALEIDPSHPQARALLAQIAGR